ncbi:hypothetical protein Cal7507_0479 [Calothrix sp. PCC 7507]|nr:hypothetical protein Cal7507_0479 [Calothrix sp. PCC 7507]
MNVYNSILFYKIPLIQEVKIALEKALFCILELTTDSRLLDDRPTKLIFF